MHFSQHTTFKDIADKYNRVVAEFVQIYIDLLHSEFYHDVNVSSLDETSLY